MAETVTAPPVRENRDGPSRDRSRNRNMIPKPKLWAAQFADGDTSHVWAPTRTLAVLAVRADDHRPIASLRPATALARLRQQVETVLGLDAGDMTEDECRDALAEERRRQNRYVREAGR